MLVDIDSAKILIVDDEKLICRQVRALLGNFGYQSGFILRPEDLFQRLETEVFDLILMDINMPNTNGVELLKQVKRHNEFHKIPVIMLTADKDEHLMAECFEYGASDFILKPISELILKARVKAALAVKIHENELETLVEKRTLELQESNDKIENLNKELEIRIRQLEIMATTDSLTGCANQNKLKEDLKGSKKGTLVYFKLTNLAEINDGLGLEAGDSAILQMTKDLAEWLGEQGKLYRCSKSEFAILLGIDIEEGLDFCNSLMDRVSELNCTFKQNRIVLNITISYTSTEYEDPILCALLALGEAIKNKKIQIYDDAINFQEQYMQHLVASMNVSDGFDQNLFFPVFQGIRDNRKDSPHYQKINKYECLIRLELNGKVLSPYFFIRALERSREMTRATKVMIMKSCDLMHHNDYDFSLNLTEQDLLDETTYDFIEYQFKGNKIDPKRVTFEILEGISSTDAVPILELLKNLRDLGCKIAIDDFGVEQSNIGRLLNFRPDFIKIDAKFIKNLATDKNSRIIVENIYDLATRMGAEVVAEFVENQEIQDVLEEIGVHYSQGYLFSKPTKELPESSEESNQ